MFSVTHFRTSRQALMASSSQIVRMGAGTFSLGRSMWSAEVGEDGRTATIESVAAGVPEDAQAALRLA
jgi:hypothetical protein